MMLYTLYLYSMSMIVKLKKKIKIIITNFKNRWFLILNSKPPCKIFIFPWFSPKYSWSIHVSKLQFVFLLLTCLLLQGSHLRTQKSRGKISFPPLRSKVMCCGNQCSWHWILLLPPHEGKGTISHSFQAWDAPPWPRVRPSSPASPPAALPELSCAGDRQNPRYHWGTGAARVPKLPRLQSLHRPGAMALPPTPHPFVTVWSALKTMQLCTLNVSKRVCVETALPFFVIPKPLPTPTQGLRHKSFGGWVRGLKERNSYTRHSPFSLMPEA